MVPCHFAAHLDKKTECLALKPRSHLQRDSLQLPDQTQVTRYKVTKEIREDKLLFLTLTFLSRTHCLESMSHHTLLSQLTRVPDTAYSPISGGCQRSETCHH